MNKIVALAAIAILLLNLVFFALGTITPTTFWIILAGIGLFSWWMKKKQ